MTVIFPIIQSQITDPSQNVLIPQSDTQDISEIFILPHEPMQLEPYGNNTVVLRRAGETQPLNNNLLNFTVSSRNITALYNLTAEQSKLFNINGIQSKIYKVSDQGRIITNEVNESSQIKGFSVTNPMKTNQPFGSKKIFNNNSLTNDQTGTYTFTVDSQENDVLTANERELNPNYEITADLKNYATVNVIEPIPTQISYNIGTESVDADEPLKNTESMTLEESSVISEIENPDNIFDTINNTNILDSQKDTFVEEFFRETNDENFNSLFIEPKGIIEKDSNFIGPKIDLIDLNKQIRTTEAIEMSLVCDEEIPSQWIDVMSLATSHNPTDLYEPSLLNENPLSAIPTAIQSYIDIKSSKSTSNYKNSELYMFNTENFEFNREQTEKEIEGVINDTIKEITAQKELLNSNAQKVIDNKTRNTDENLLKNLTAEANICTCVDCKCGPENNCSQDDSCYLKNTVVDNARLVVKDQKKENCCGKSVSCNCSGKTETECCVMVCLKSLDQLRHVLSLANKCCSLQSLTKSFSSSSDSCCNK